MSDVNMEQIPGLTKTVGYVMYLKAQNDKLQREADQLRAELEAADVQKERWVAWAKELGEKCDKLKAELEAISGQEPVAWRAKCNTGFILELCLPDADDERATLDWQPLYKHPSKQPDSDSVPLYEAIEDACALLPYGWLIEVCAEREAGWVTLHDGNGEKVNFPTNNERLDYTVNDAVEFALLSTCPPVVNSR